MTITTLALTAPIPTSAWSDHPALIFYAKYGVEFGENHDTCEPEKYYNTACMMYHTDRSTLQGAGKLWSFFGSLYESFPRVTRDILTLLVVSDDEAGTHRIHAEVQNQHQPYTMLACILTWNQMVTTLYTKGGSGSGVAVPQTFVYTLGKAVSLRISSANLISLLTLILVGRGQRDRWATVHGAQKLL